LAKDNTTLTLNYVCTECYLTAVQTVSHASLHCIFPVLKVN